MLTMIIYVFSVKQRITFVYMEYLSHTMVLKRPGLSCKEWQLKYYFHHPQPTQMKRYETDLGMPLCQLRKHTLKTMME